MFGLPLHPLVVHFAVAFLIVVPTLVLVGCFWGRLRDRVDWLYPLAGIAAGVAGLAAGATGDELLHSMGHSVSQQIRAHADLGEKVEPLGVVFAVVTVLWWLATGPSIEAFVAKRLPWLRSNTGRIVATALAVLGSIAVMVVVFLAGDAGARAVWGQSS